MKKICLLGVLIVSFSYGQITDENGTIAIGQSNVQLSGKIGIGTGAPTEALDIIGTTKISKDLRIGEQNGDGIFVFKTNPTSDSHSMTLYGNNGNARGYLTASSSRTQLSLINIDGQEVFNLNTGDLGVENVFLQMPRPDSRIVVSGFGDYLPEHKFVVKDGSAMIEGDILTEGNIGIGTKSFVDGTDTYRLSIDGKVRAHAVKVYTDWADFVFEPDYKLPTLGEVEKYIEVNGHLKNIPSAKEVENHGVELGEMNKLLLQKIEELTLYTIQLKKELEVLKSKIE